MQFCFREVVCRLPSVRPDKAPGLFLRVVSRVAARLVIDFSVSDCILARECEGCCGSSWDRGGRFLEFLLRGVPPVPVIVAIARLLLLLLGRWLRAMDDDHVLEASLS